MFKSSKLNSEVNEYYTLYKTNSIGEISNRFVEKLTIYLTKKYPGFFDKLHVSLVSSGIKILSKTYVSIMIFFSIIAFTLATVISFLFFKDIPILLAIKSMTFGLMALIATFIVFYIYPALIINSRTRKMKNDLPFVIMHMSAIAGSGAQPISMFNLAIKTEEYKSLKDETTKIINYVNLFGYDLPTALKIVASTTPSRDFRELLNGIVSTIESGGDLKDYLTQKADDALLNYKLERRKYVESLSTYSDIYTGVLIAAPLLFFITLAIIQMLGGSIMGVSAKTLATAGTFLVIPVLNTLFILFLNLIQPET